VRVERGVPGDGRAARRPCPRGDGLARLASPADPAGGRGRALRPRRRAHGGCRRTALLLGLRAVARPRLARPRPCRPRTAGRRHRERRRAPEALTAAASGNRAVYTGQMARREPSRTVPVTHDFPSDLGRVIEALPFAVYVCDAPGGAIRAFNQPMVELWGREPEKGDSYARGWEGSRVAGLS